MSRSQKDTTTGRRSGRSRSARRSASVVAGATSAALLLSMASPAIAEAPKKDRKDNGLSQARHAVTGKAVHKHLRQFQWIADRNGDNRATGTPGYEKSAAYVERQLRKAGYKPRRQYFDVESFGVDSFSFAASGVEVKPGVLSYSSSTPAGGVTAPLTVPTGPLGCDAGAYAGSDVTGKVVLVNRGTCAFGDKAAAAGAAGAAAVIIANNEEGPLNGTLGGRLDGSAPGVGVTQAEGNALRTALEAGPVEVKVDVQTTVKMVRTFNVLADTKGGNAKNVVMVGAHLDSTAEGPGINDNASGSAAVLETALQLAKKDPQRVTGKKTKKSVKKKGTKYVNNKVRFAWWGAEELGLHGSNHYVANLKKKAPKKLDALAVYLNFDMIGSPNHIVGVYDANQSTYPAAVKPPKGSVAAERAFTRYFDKRNEPWVDTEYSGRSDYQAFIQAGVPSTGLFSGGDGKKTAAEVKMFGGKEGVDYDPNYHQAGDDITNINRKALDVMSRAIGTVVTDMAHSTRSINGVKPPKRDKYGVKVSTKKNKKKSRR